MNGKTAKLLRKYSKCGTDKGARPHYQENKRLWLTTPRTIKGELRVWLEFKLS
jgi:hypothetical protein